MLRDMSNAEHFLEKLFELGLNEEALQDPYLSDDEKQAVIDCYHYIIKYVFGSKEEYVKYMKQKESEEVEDPESSQESSSEKVSDLYIVGAEDAWKFAMTVVKLPMNTFGEMFGPEATIESIKESGFRKSKDRYNNYMKQKKQKIEVGDVVVHEWSSQKAVITCVTSYGQLYGMTANGDFIHIHDNGTWVKTGRNIASLHSTLKELQQQEERYNE